MTQPVRQPLNFAFLIWHDTWSSVSCQYATKEQEEGGKRRYEEQKLERIETKVRNGNFIHPVINPGKNDSRG